MSNANLLRRIAEHASGMRSLRLWYRVDGDDFTVHLSKPGGAVVIPSETPEVGKRPDVTYAYIGIGEKPNYKLMNLREIPGHGTADAVFWSESAVEKFLIPYYASVAGAGAARAICRILRSFYGTADGCAKAGGSGWTDVFALVHIPTSEYVEGSVPGLIALRSKTTAEGVVEIEAVRVGAEEAGEKA
jgi:hypothetical protein